MWKIGWRIVIHIASGFNAMVEHGRALMKLHFNDFRRMMIHNCLAKDKSTLPVLHEKCKYMRGHHVRQFHIQAVHEGGVCPWQKEDWNLLVKELLPGTGESAIDLGVDSYESAEQHLAWLNCRLAREISGAHPWTMPELTMAFCLRPKKACAHKHSCKEFRFL